MKKHLFKFALTLFVCMLSNAALAVEDPNCFPFQDFSGFTISGNGPVMIKDWEVYYCDYVSSIQVLKVAGHNVNNTDGYARTPTLGYAGDVHLSFKYAKTNKTEKTSIIMNILNGGTFKDNNDTSLEILDIDHLSDGFTTGDYDIVGVTSDTRIEFRGQRIDIDDVSVTKDGMTLDESIDNDPWITGNYNETITVKTVRKLNADKWNTLCLPFDVDMNVLEGTFGANKGIQLRVFDEYDDATYTMKFKTPENNSIAAGTPFLIKVNEDIVNPTFTGVTISDVSAQPNGNDGVSFVGTYSRKELAIDGTNLFITTDNELAKPTATGNKMPGLRAYIVVPENFNTRSARLFLDDEATAINSIGTQKATNSATLYNLQGQRVEHPRSGLYIKNNKLTIIR